MFLDHAERFIARNCSTSVLLTGRERKKQFVAWNQHFGVGGRSAPLFSPFEEGRSLHSRYFGMRAIAAFGGLVGTSFYFLPQRTWSDLYLCDCARLPSPRDLDSFFRDFGGDSALWCPTLAWTILADHDGNLGCAIRHDFPENFETGEERTENRE